MASSLLVFADVLQALERWGCEGVIIDITGLNVVDSYVARVLADTARMARLMGAETVLVGMRPEVAATLVRMGYTMAGVRTALDVDEGADRIEFGGTICLAVAGEGDAASRRSRIVGGREWVRLGAVEMGLDCLRRYLQGLPVWERTDFEKVDKP